MPRLLIVSPHFPPVNTPDLQRVRMSLPHFVDAGWEVVVLTVDDREPMAPLERELLETVPTAVQVERAPIFSRRWTRFLGVNNLGLRALPHLYARGNTLLRGDKFDLVYFSTTQFVVLALGRLWWREFDVPYVIDLQDPWLNDYYSQPGAPKPPGGWKYSFAHGTARLLEGWTLSRAAHVISVSERYLTTLRRRYPWFGPERGSVLTFGAPDEDFATAQRLNRTAPRLLPARPTLKIAYAGRLGADMNPALEHLFAAVARLRDTARPVELFFFGTSYAPAHLAVATTTGLAAAHGITGLVHEHPARIGYLDSLRLLLETDVALLLGSEDKAYSPSKVYPTLLADRPALAIAPAGSVLENKVRELGGAGLVTFGRARDEAAIAGIEQLLRAVAVQPDTRPGAPTDRERLARDYTAAAIAAKQLEIFNRLIHPPQAAAPTMSAAAYWPDEEAPVPPAA